MTIVGGRWVADEQTEEPITDFNSMHLKELGQKVAAIYGENITHTRIHIIERIQKLTEQQEEILAEILTDDRLFLKLAGK